jgi:hypothetical protein
MTGGVGPTPGGPTLFAAALPEELQWARQPASGEVAQAGGEPPHDRVSTKASMRVRVCWARPPPNSTSTCRRGKPASAR